MDDTLLPPDSLLWQTAREIADTVVDEAGIVLLRTYPLHMQAAVVVQLGASVLAQFLDLHDGLGAIIQKWPIKDSQRMVLRVMNEAVNIHSNVELQKKFTAEFESIRKYLGENDDIYYGLGSLGVDYQQPIEFFKLVEKDDGKGFVMKKYKDTVAALFNLQKYLNEHEKPYQMLGLPIELKQIAVKKQNLYSTPVVKVPPRKYMPEDANFHNYLVQTDGDQAIYEMVHAGRAFLKGRMQLCILLLASLFFTFDANSYFKPQLLFQAYTWMAISFSKLYARIDITLHCLKKMKQYSSLPFDDVIILLTRQTIMKNYGLFDQGNRIFNYLQTHYQIPPQSSYYQQFWINSIQNIFCRIEDELVELTLDRKFHLLCKTHCSQLNVNMKIQHIKLTLEQLKSHLYGCLSNIGQITELKMFFEDMLIRLDIYSALLKMFDPYSAESLCSKFESVYYTLMAKNLTNPCDYRRLVQKLIFIVSRQPTPNHFKEIEDKFESYYLALDVQADLSSSFATCMHRYTFVVIMAVAGKLSNTVLTKTIASLKTATNSRHYRIKLVGALLGFNLMTTKRHKYYNYGEYEPLRNKYLNLGTKTAMDFYENCTGSNSNKIVLFDCITNGAQILNYIKSDPDILSNSISFGLETATHNPRI